MTTPAIYNVMSGRVHLDSGRRMSSAWRPGLAAVGACGHNVEYFDLTTWEQADTKHRCRVCGKRGPIEGKDEHGPIEEGQA